VHTEHFCDGLQLEALSDGDVGASYTSDSDSENRYEAAIGSSESFSFQDDLTQSKSKALSPEDDGVLLVDSLGDDDFHSVTTCEFDSAMDRQMLDDLSDESSSIMCKAALV